MDPVTAAISMGGNMFLGGISAQRSARKNMRQARRDQFFRNRSLNSQAQGLQRDELKMRAQQEVIFGAAGVGGASVRGLRLDDARERRMEQNAILAGVSTSLQGKRTQSGFKPIFKSLGKKLKKLF